MSLRISDARELSYSDFLTRYSLWEGERQKFLSRGDLEEQRLKFLENPDYAKYESARAECLIQHVKNSICALNRLDTVEGDFAIGRVQQRQALAQFLSDIYAYKEAARKYSKASFARCWMPESQKTQASILQDKKDEEDAIKQLRFLQHV
ncbi:hypothetical protein [Acetobacter persici]|uniref:hypothetical protein n=1 Tax=Acetobacter persici TaxID=1076596 RepID=UPI001BAD6E88|nr:hypothetical protein [Acetobacter persici]MBS1017078.1 hypothetical protein [Acetobacter persici]